MGTVTLRVFRLIPLFAAALFLAPAIASGQVTKDQCVDANASAQQLRRDGKLGAAREQLEICVDARCPGIVRDDCAKRLDEVERAQPTIVFDAKDVVGNDVGAVRVTVDGRPLTDKLDGAALAVDPGDHVFAFGIRRQALVTRRLVLHEGEKGRRERVVLATAAPSPGPLPPAASDATSPPAESPAESGGGARKPTGMLLGGAGIVGIAVGSVFGVMTIVSWNNSKSECRSPATPENCPHYDEAVPDRDSAIKNGTISTIGFVAGGALLAGGLALWLTAPSEDVSSAPVAGIRVTPSVGARAAGIAVEGEF